MRIRGKKSPTAATAGRGNGDNGKSPSRTYPSTWPVVLQVRKRGRWVVVGKVVKLNGKPVLATAVRHQRGTKDVVSMPILAVNYAERCKARYWYWRHDRQMTMSRIRLSDLRETGWWQGGELYVKLSDMEPVPYQEWAYIERAVKLGRPEPEAVQLGLEV